jgi:hypothetical protein
MTHVTKKPLSIGYVWYAVVKLGVGEKLVMGNIGGEFSESAADLRPESQLASSVFEREYAAPDIRELILELQVCPIHPPLQKFLDLYREGVNQHLEEVRIGREWEIGFDIEGLI